MGVGMDVVAYDVAWGVGDSTSGGEAPLPRAPARRSRRRSAVGTRSPSASCTSAASGLLRGRAARGGVGDSFQQALAEALREIPWGEVAYRRARGARRPARYARAAAPLCAENNFPLVVDCRASAATAASAPGTSAVCSRWRASTSDPLRGCQAGACGDRAAEGLLPAGRALRARCAARAASICAEGGASRSTWSWRDGAGRARLAASLLWRPLRDQDVQAGRAFEQGTRCASPRGRRTRPPALAGVLQHEPRPARAAPAPGGRRPVVGPRSAAPSSPPARSAAPATLISSSGRPTPTRRAFCPDRAEGFNLAVHERSRHSLAYAKGTRRSATCWRSWRSDRGAAARRGAIMAWPGARANRLANADHANIVRTSRAATSSSAPSAAWSREGRLEELAPELREIAQPAGAAPDAVAARARQALRPSEGGRTAPAARIPRLAELCFEGRRGSSEDDLPLHDHASGPGAERGLNPTPDERGTRSGQA